MCNLHIQRSALFSSSGCYFFLSFLQYSFLHVPMSSGILPSQMHSLFVLVCHFITVSFWHMNFFTTSVFLTIISSHFFHSCPVSFNFIKRIKYTEKWEHCPIVKGSGVVKDGRWRLFHSFCTASRPVKSARHGVHHYTRNTVMETTIWGKIPGKWHIITKKYLNIQRNKRPFLRIQ